MRRGQFQGAVIRIVRNISDSSFEYHLGSTDKKGSAEAVLAELLARAVSAGQDGVALSILRDALADTLAV